MFWSVRLCLIIFSPLEGVDESLNLFEGPPTTSKSHGGSYRRPPISPALHEHRKSLPINGVRKIACLVETILGHSNNSAINLESNFWQLSNRKSVFFNLKKCIYLQSNCKEYHNLKNNIKIIEVILGGDSEKRRRRKYDVILTVRYYSREDIWQSYNRFSKRFFFAIFFTRKDICNIRLEYLSGKWIYLNATWIFMSPFIPNPLRLSSSVFVVRMKVSVEWSYVSSRTRLQHHHINDSVCQTHPAFLPRKPSQYPHINIRDLTP